MRREPAGRSSRLASAPQLSGALELFGRGLPAGPQKLAVGVRQRPLVGGAEEVAAVDLRALVIEDGRLDGAVEELVGVAAEELVKSVLSGDVHGEPPAPSPRSAPHLAQRGDGAGEGHHDRRVELADVDPQLEGIGGDYRAELACHQALLELAPLLGGVPGAIGRNLLGEGGVGLLDLLADQPAEDLDPLARLHEADRPCTLADQL